MSALITAVVGSAVVGAWAAGEQADAAGEAAQIQGDAAQAGVAENRRQFDQMRELLQPYVDAGGPALTGQQNLIGLNGNNAQQQAIDAIRNGSQFQTMQQMGENRILQNASATGGLRGGNTQAAIGQFSPQLLNQLIEQQYGQLGGMVQLGQNSAAGVGAAGMQTGNNIAQLLQQQGAAAAGGALAQGNAYAGYANAINGGIGMYAGLGGFGGQSYPGGGAGVVSGGSGIKF